MFAIADCNFLQIIRHGGCLGLGLAAMGTARQGMYTLFYVKLKTGLIDILIIYTKMLKFLSK